MVVVNQVRRIAILMSQDLSFCRNVIRGIRAYALQKTNWAFHSGPPERESLSYLQDWKPHGIIANLSVSEVARAVVKMRKPLVDTACTLPDLGIPVVDVDHIAVGRLAAKYFLDRGFTYFGFFGSEKVLYSQLRETAFREELAGHRRTVSSCYYEYLRCIPDQMSWKTIDRKVEKWLQCLPKPVAILACNDAPARNLADMCRRLGMHIPNQVALLGVDDNEVECPLTFPPLSSIMIPSERIGYEAAKLLDRMMLGEPPPRTPLFLSPLRIVTRQSTDTMAINDPEVLAAVTYIRRCAAERINVGKVAREIRCGRRDLERRFRLVLGRSVLDEIRLARVERAKEMLLATKLAMPNVARQAGFLSSARLAVVFRHLVGMTPTAYRRQATFHDRSLAGE
jgi:LacI family transcriptional regulator